MSPSKRKLISTGSPFELQYGYSRAVVDCGIVHISGTTGYDYATMTMPEDVAAQARNIYKTFAATLAQCGAVLEDIVRLRTFVTNADFLQTVCEVQGEVFATIRPASSIFVISGLLRPEMKVEIEADARLPNS